MQNAINAIAGFAGTVTVSSFANTGFTLTYSGASAGVDVPEHRARGARPADCFSTVEESNHGGTMDSFRLNYNGNVSGLITNGPTTPPPSSGLH